MAEQSGGSKSKTTKQHFKNESKEIENALFDMYCILNSTKSTANNLFGKMQAMNWSGEYVVHIRALMEIVLDYHKALSDATYSVRGAIKSFPNHYVRYYNIKAYKKIKEMT
jgi:methylthioribose-1-phosphate isomerase